MTRLEDIEAASWLDGSRRRLFEQWRADRGLDPLGCATPVEAMRYIEQLEDANHKLHRENCQLLNGEARG